MSNRSDGNRFGKPAEKIAGWLNQLGLKLPRLGRVPGIVCLCSFVATAFVVVTQMNPSASMSTDIRYFEVGRVADRDVVAEHSFSYVDEYATSLRIEAQTRLVPAVFRHTATIGEDALRNWEAFCTFADGLVEGDSSLDVMRLKLHAEFPARFSDEIITAYFSVPDRSMFREYGERLLSGLFARGIFDLDAVDLGGYNPDMVELLLFYGDRTERERVSFGSITSLANVGEAITRAAAAEDMPQSFKSIASGLLRPFVSANVLFSREDTELRVAEVVERVTPVEIRIEEGERVIRRGFVITADEMRNLEELSASFPRQNPRNIVGHVVMLAMLYVLFILLQDRVVIGRDLSSGERSLLFVLVFLNMACAGLVQNIAPSMGNVPVALIFPTALFVMIPAAFMGSMMALAMALALPLSACLAGFFDVPSYVFALTSGVAASSVLRRAEKRMDIINASLIIAAVNCLATLVILLMRAATFAEYPMMLFWAALNGIVSGMLFLGVLAPLEHALNAPTAFRLIELSDLNAPTLRKLFTTAPGTYSHSVMVATLAEQACQDIGANALLARVGAYYHDIGKMDNPDYFVENQTDHNRHDDIAPRLSATVIRSHVKLGVEKARSLGLPEDIINIVSEHHGNSLITWFYNKATEQEEQVHSEDFAYPGSPPRSRESAVVMLADVTEAAVRTLVKPTAAKMEKFIQQLFDAKVEHGQLSQSELTFRDLETIKNAFVKVLAGYYHSRIEYPKENA